ncbi:hypothetical protein F8388_013691 [Cannabis sativa]|uniref:Uncharacterized protein n=1 Tax=Cannabis sativa TaxID=3483 RepID=A0A7J6EKB1_CANSA|nr:hypothetical protein F8388_013691 [Cannabis sativa]
MKCKKRLQWNQENQTHSLLMPPTTFGSPSLELSDGAAAPGTKQQDSAAIGRGHLPKLGPEALIIRVSFAPALPGQPIDLLRTILDSVFLL